MKQLRYDVFVSIVVVSSLLSAVENSCRCNFVVSFSCHFDHPSPFETKNERRLWRMLFEDAFLPNRFLFRFKNRPLYPQNHWRQDILTVPIVPGLISGTMCFRPILQPPKHRRRGLPDPPWAFSQTLVSPPRRWLLFRFKIINRNHNWTKHGLPKTESCRHFYS